MRLVYEPILPKEYTRLEYLASTATQYILTGFTPTVNTDFEIELSSTDTLTRWAMGCPTWVGVHYKTGTEVGITNSSTSAFQQYTTYNHDNSRLTMKLVGNTVYANDVSLGTITRRAGTLDFALFGYRDANQGATLNFIGKIYKCIIRENGEVVRNYIPALRNSDSKPGMYDTVSGTFYTNDGSGEFNYVLPKEDDSTIDNPKYQQVEYLESDGNQYIDTGYSSNDIYSNGAFEIICSTAGMSNRVVGCGGLDNNNKNINLSFSGGGYILGLYGNKWNSDTFSYNINTKYKIKFGFTTSQQELYVNDTLVETTNSSWNSTDNYPLRIFKTNADTYTKASKIYSFKLWINGILIRNFIPVLRKVDNKPGMFDKVSGNFYINQSTGEFTYGDKVNQKLPDAYEKLEYIETTNQQTNASDTTNASWIDTGIVPDDTTQMECRMSFSTLVSGNSNEALFGSTGSTGNFRFAFGYASLSPYTNFYMGLGGQNLTTSVTRDTNVHTFKLDAINKTWTIDDVSGSFTSSGSLSGTSSIFLFARHLPYYGDNVANKPANARTYYCKIWQNNTIVRDLVPALRKSDNKPGLYDFASGQFFTKNGSGAEFTYKYPPKPLSNSKLRIVKTGGYTIYDDLYKGVEYLQATGTQKIDTGYKPNNNTKIELVGKFNDTYPCCLWATRWSQSPNYDTYGAYAENNSAGMLYIYCGRYSDGNFIGVPNADFPHRDGNFIRFIQDRNTLDFTNLGTGNNWTYTFAEEEFQSTNNLTLFYFNSSSAFNTKGGYIKSCKIWDNGALVRDYVPVIRMSDNEPGMYDKKNKVFYTNTGTGTFTYPTPTLTKPLVTRLIAGGYIASIYRPLQYLESTGTQYIDTGLTSLDVDTIFESTFAVRTVTSSGNVLYGADSILTGIQNGNVVFTTIPAVAETFYKTRLEYTVGQNRKIYVNDEYIGEASSYHAIYPIYLFGLGASQSIAQIKSFMIKETKITLDGQLVRDFIPVLRTLDNKPGMFDKVTGQFFTNQGTGEFTYA